MRNTFIIAREGYRGLLILAIIIAFFYFLDFGFLLFLVALLFFIYAYCFRNVEREVVEITPSTIFAPIDGKITNINSENGIVSIKIKVGLFDVGMIRSVNICDNIQNITKNGLTLCFGEYENKIAETLNAKYEIVTDDVEYLIRPSVFAGGLYDVSKAISGERIGFIKSGYLILRIRSNLFELKVTEGNSIKAGQTIMGYMK